MTDESWAEGEQKGWSQKRAEATKAGVDRYRLRESDPLIREGMEIIYAHVTSGNRDCIFDGTDYTKKVDGSRITVLATVAREPVGAFFAAIGASILEWAEDQPWDVVAKRAAKGGSPPTGSFGRYPGFAVMYGDPADIIVTDERNTDLIIGVAVALGQSKEAPRER